jgi:hypothetical protein
MWHSQRFSKKITPLNSRAFNKFLVTARGAERRMRRLTLHNETANPARQPQAD